MLPKNIREIGATGISTPPVQDAAFDVYDLQGRKVRFGATSLSGLPHGVYIVNGRKVVVR